MKPPLAFEIPAILSMLSNGDPFAFYMISVILSSIATVGIIITVGKLAGELTDNDFSRLLAGATVFTHASVFWYPAIGFSPKAISLFAGLTAILFSLREKPVVAGLVGGVSAGIWQFSVVFIGIALFIITDYEDWNKFVRFLLAVATVAVLTVVPIILMGGGKAMLVETIYIPLSGTEGGGSPLYNLIRTISLLGFAALPVTAGVVGVGTLLNRGNKKTMWLPIALIFSLFQVLTDIDYYPDTFLLLIFASIGVGVLVNRIGSNHRLAFGIAIVLVIIFNAFLLIGAGPFSTAHQPNQVVSDFYNNAPSVEYNDQSTSESIKPFYNMSKSDYLNKLYYDKFRNSLNKPWSGDFRCPSPNGLDQLITSFVECRR